ncbi:hypothetical protein ACP4OV_019231 [Aristida adscensionis]
MAPQLQGCYWVSSWPRLQQLPPWSRSSDLPRRRLLRLAPPRRHYAGAVRVVADAGPALARDAVGIQFPTGEGVGRVAGSVEEREEDLDERERLRRMRISQANKGNTPWNKGRKHSPETLQRIRERTRIAMQDPKVKKKLMNLGHAQSAVDNLVVGHLNIHVTESSVGSGFGWESCRPGFEPRLQHLSLYVGQVNDETRIKISQGVRRGWSLRLQRLMVQDGCFVEWRDMIADAARMGFAGGVAFQWNSYKILTEQLRQEWLENLQKRRSMPRPSGNRRAPKTPEQRRKIAEAIAAKWLDQEYRDRVCSGIANYHGTSSGPRRPRKPRSPREPGVKRETTKKKPIQARAVRLEDTHGKAATIKRKKSATPYKDPLAVEKLEMITKIRAQRAAIVIEKKEAIKRARSLIAEAEKAANALESAAATSPYAQASLIAARKLVTEARVSLECVDEGPAENGSDDMSEESTILDLNDHGWENQNQSNMMKQDNKPVNKMKVLSSNVNGTGFHFDSSMRSETEQLYQSIENSMERAFLLPSASSTLNGVNGDFGIIDFQVRQMMVNETTQNDQIVAESTEYIPPETLQEDAPLSAKMDEATDNFPPGTLEEDTPSLSVKGKARWVRGRLVREEK